MLFLVLSSFIWWQWSIFPFYIIVYSLLFPKDLAHTVNILGLSKLIKALNLVMIPENISAD